MSKSIAVKSHRAGWPLRFPIGRTVFALAVIPPLTLLIPGIVNSQLFVHQPGDVSTGLSSIGRTILAILILACPGYVIFAILGIPLLYVFSRFNWTRLWAFAVVGMICTEIPWFLIAATSHSDPETTRARLWDALPTYALVGMLNGIITRLIVLGWRRPL